MKTLVCSLAVAFGMLASNVMAQDVLTVDGEEYLLSDLMANCQSITDDPAAQISCFSAISKLMEEQGDDAPETEIPVAEKLDELRAVAQYQDDDSGLLIGGSDCNIHIVYFNNYFHISRRNISTFDLFSAQFDASKLQFDQSAQGSQAPLLQASMAPGAKASLRGGIELDSSLDNFESKSPRVTMSAYASEVAGQLPPREAQSFEFVLVHPQRSSASAEIFTAFEAFTDACRRSPPSWSAPTLGNG